MRRSAITRIGRIGILAVLALLGLLGWALYWPENSCAQPACARQRFSLAIELDAFQQVPRIPLEVRSGENVVSLREILAAGGIDVTIEVDQLDLPYSAASGALDRADLHQFAAAWRSNTMPPGADAKIYALVASALISDTGEPLFGIMFDDRDREGFAVAPGTTADRFRAREPEAISILQLRTFAHELLHALNRRHIDAVSMPDGRLTLEAPTRCISGQQRNDWYLREQPLMEVSPETIRFFQTARPRDVLPGWESSSFDPRRVSLTECEDARANAAGDPVRTRWQLARRRLHHLLSLQVASAAEEVQPMPDESQTGGEGGEADEAQRVEGEHEGQEQTQEGPPPSVDLRLQVLPAAYPLGYPIAVRLIARNVGEQALPIKGRLMPSYGIVHIEHRAAGAEEWLSLEPLAWFEPAGDAEAMLAPGERTEQTVPVYFGEAGWTFPQAGEYELRAKLHIGDEQDVLSEPAALRVAAAHTEDDRAALQPLLDERGELDEQVGRLLTFGGRIGAASDIAPLEAAADRYGHTALGAALRLTLISQRLRPPIDPLTGVRPPPDLSDARELLQDTCTDSGIAALKRQLLLRHAGSIPKGMAHRAETGFTAWEGTTSLRGEAIATYSDETLHRWGPTLHFCFDDAQLRGPARSTAERLARRLRRERPARIVVVGHGDYAGSCRYNDALALRRAESMRRLLIEAGISPRRIQAASLGERRPLDFAATATAHELNRRVELLVEPALPAFAPDSSTHVLSSCARTEDG